MSQQTFVRGVKAETVEWFDMRDVTAVDLCRPVKRPTKTAGLSINLSPNLFRVTVATDLLNQNVPPSQVLNLLGHSNLLDDQALRQAAE